MSKNGRNGCECLRGINDMGKSSQRKGRGGELELCRVLNAAGLSVSPGVAVSYGGTPDAVGLQGYHLEIKRVEKLNLERAMAQSIRDAERFGDGKPLVVHRKNRREWLVTMRLTDWLELYQGGGECDGPAEDFR